MKYETIMLIVWSVLTMIFISYLAFVLHKSDIPSHTKTAGFLGTTAIWLILSAVVLAVISYFDAT